MKILILVTGSISAYKAVDIANSFRHKGHEVKIAMTKAATQFIPKITFTGQRFECYTDEDEWNSTNSGVLHIDLAHWADTILLAPATSNTIGKFVNGITDNLVISIMRAFNGTIYIAPAMNTQMYHNSKPFLDKLQQFNTIVINPQEKLLACGDFGMGGLAAKDIIVNTVIRPLFPIKMKYVGATFDSDSFKTIDYHTEVELPLHSHCGSYQYVRKHHTHEGVDLYADEGTPVYACEEGTVVSYGWFTGTNMESPWWCDTQYIAVHVGNITNVYGEMTLAPELKIGHMIKKGQYLGTVKRVLINDKGRPMSMLHFEQHNYRLDMIEWDARYINNPTYTINPTQYLACSIKFNEANND